jgi:hypothetical protein
MDDLLKIITSVDYEDYGSLQLIEVERRDGNLSFVLDVTADEEPELPRNIRITCHSSRESNVSPSQYYDLSVAEDHVLLWHYTRPHTLTSFYGKVEDPLSVVGALYERHFELVEEWIPFHKYLNSGLPLSELIRGSFGMLADGPDQLVLAYEAVMQRFGFSTSHHESRSAMHWDGERWVQDRSPLSILFLDESYVIAEAFAASAI